MGMFWLMIVAWAVGYLGVFWWWQHCVDRTLEDRSGAREWAYAMPALTKWRLKIIDDVSYGAHTWRLMTFRDPWALYSRSAERLVRRLAGAPAKRPIWMTTP